MSAIQFLPVQFMTLRPKYDREYQRWYYNCPCHTLFWADDPEMRIGSETHPVKKIIVVGDRVFTKATEIELTKKTDSGFYYVFERRTPESKGQPWRERIRGVIDDKSARKIMRRQWYEREKARGVMT